MTAAKAELDKLNVLHDTLQRQKDRYSANQVAVQIKAGEAWIDFLSGDKNKGLQLMQLAAAMEDSTEKHPVTPGEVLPARELLADMYLDADENEKRERLPPPRHSERKLPRNRQQQISRGCER